MSSEPLRQMLVNPWNMKSLFTYICSTGLLDVFSLLIHILFRDLFLQQRSCILGCILGWDIRGGKRLLETKECKSGRKGRSSGKAKTGDPRDCSSLRRV